MRSPLRLAVLLLAPLLVGCGALLGLRPLATAHAGRTSYHQIVVGGRVRTFLLHLPPAAARGPVPLVLLLHGHHGSGALMREQSGMDDAADHRGLFPGIGPQAARLDGSAVVLDFFARYGVGGE